MIVTSLRTSFACILLTFYVNSACAQTAFSGLITFGDSLSDTGNLASVTTDFPFPFFENRISNGPVLVDYLAAELGFQALASRHSQTIGGDNFAIAGGNILGNDVEDLSPQISAFLAREGGQADSSNLYFVMMGGNDLRDIRSIKSRGVAEARIDQVIQTLEFELNRLYDSGARTFLISNVADIGRIPESLAREPSDPGVTQRARSYVEIYNRQLDFLLQRLQSKPNVAVSQFNLFSELDRILNSATSFGFTQTRVGCFSLQPFSFHPDCIFGTRFDRFVFFDNIHPSASANRIVSSALIASIPSPNLNSSRPIIVAPIIKLLLD